MCAHDFVSAKRPAPSANVPRPSRETVPSRPAQPYSHVRSRVLATSHPRARLSRDSPRRRRAPSPLVCHGHSRPIVNPEYSHVTPDGVFLIRAVKMGNRCCGAETPGITTFQGYKGCVWDAGAER